MAQNLFQKIGYEIEIANNGSEAVSKLTQQNYDIIFMDLIMPELNGFDATIKIRQTNKTVPIVAMTANNDDMQKHKAFSSGFDDFIVKPAQKEDINRMLTKWCAE